MNSIFPKIRTFIIEDDERTQEKIKRIVTENVPEIEIIGYSSSKKDAIGALKKHMPDLLLMDIILKDGEAFEILNQFPANTFEIIFITGHSQFVKKAFEYFAFNFLSKPFEDKELIALIKQFSFKREKTFDTHRFMVMRDYLNNIGSKFLINTGIEFLAVDLNDIVNCKSDGNYTKIFLQNGKTILASKPLKYYEKILSDKEFYRLTRFDLINKAHISSIYRKETVTLSNGVRININSRNKIVLENIMQNLPY